MPAGLRHLILVAALFALLLPANAKASGGSYTFSGGSEAARAEVRNALDASAFDWSLVPQTISIQIVDCGCAGSRPGVIVLDETLLESTPYGRAHTWGIVQHEYAHQVWWFALDDEQRGVLLLRAARSLSRRSRLRAVREHTCLGVLASGGEPDAGREGPVGAAVSAHLGPAPRRGPRACFPRPS